ncbi:HTTM domain-containing protein [Kineococcus aurantiacus]|uniref:Putative membrane protein YphA (DoxX/SURF4 family) n=1 Tax=Kineococcus aurantiacus TaxID=37633 RepID=A0A7Y9AVN5_9ACTN|nr:putative membrane protein YphA (DoxX/SURF4 family) [Kineococcus aurantiacus]
MNRLAARFDAWAGRGDLTAVDLGRYRVLFALVLLLSPRDFAWVSAFPDSFVDGPPGPFALLHAVPPAAVLHGLEVVVGVAAAFLLVGFATRTASVVLACALLLGYGTGYSLGKIDHTIFTLLVPVVMAFARWGDAVSVDALRRRGPAPATPQWPLRLLALLVGLGFLTAAVPKLLSGWLSPATQAVQGVMFNQYYANDRTELLARSFVHLDSRWFWESLDVATVLLEGLLVLAVLNWWWWRAGIAVAALFHLGVLLMMNIGFSGNVLTYAAFVPWSRVRLPHVAWSARTLRAWRVAGPPAALVLGVFAATRPQEWTFERFNQVLVVLGALVAARHLLHVARDLLRRKGRRTVRVVDETTFSSRP